MDVLSRLQGHPLFASFTAEKLAEVVRLATAVAYRAGEVCIRGDEAGEMFGILVSGRLEAVRHGGAAERELAGIIEPGECFGEMSLLTGQSTSAEVVATADSEAVVFQQEAIGPLLATNGGAVRYLTRLITRRLAGEVKSRGGAAKASPRGAVRYSLGASGPLRILAVSCRWDDVRYACYDTSSEAPLARGRVSGVGTGDAVHLRTGPRGRRESSLGSVTHARALEAAMTSLTSPDEGVLGAATELSVIGHCVRHGGPEHHGPALVNEAVKATVRRMADLAPLDNLYNLIGIETCETLAPDVPQVAVFDTSFHLTMPEAARRYALPEEFARDETLQRFGFHGVSHESAGRAAAEFLGTGFDALRLVTCHLGAGASITAIDHGRSVDTTMGLTPLEGLVMDTRPGDVDPGLLMHLMLHRRVPVDQLYIRLFAKAGLLGLSGISGDVVTVDRAAEAGDARALLAIQMFCRRARKHLAALLGLLGGADAVVFTGGVGENSPGVRARICQGLDWMGIALDEGLNRGVRVAPGEVKAISAAQSRVRIVVVGGDEERAIAGHAARTMARARASVVMHDRGREIPIGISAHHVHLSQAHVEALFGAGHTLTWHADLTQPGQFACKEEVSLIGPKGRIDRVRVLGPVRPETQIEISRTEEFRLGIDAPVRLSGDLAGTPGITLEGPAGQVRVDRGVICAMRHIHMAPQDALELAVRDHDVVRVRVSGERSLVFGDVAVRVSPDFRLDMHIDTDEANAAELSCDGKGYLDSIQGRARG